MWSDKRQNLQTKLVLLTDLEKKNGVTKKKIWKKGCIYKYEC